MHDLLTLRENGLPPTCPPNLSKNGAASDLQEAGASWELYAILDALQEREARGRDAVLATAVQVAGPAFRTPGARMLVTKDGRRIGCVAAPAIELEIAKQARWLTESGVPITRDFGPTRVMLERTDTCEFSQVCDFLQTHRESHKPAVVATVIAVEPAQHVRIGDRLLLDESWARCGALAGSPFEAQVLTHASAALREKKSRLVRLGYIDLFVEWLGSPPVLAIFGAGRDASLLLRSARQLGWEVTLNENGWGTDPLSGVDINCDSAVVVMTHNYALDAYLLRRLLPLRPSYLGLLGSKKRSEKLFAEIGVSPGPNVHAPAGLDIGGDSPELVALSIVAEIQAKLNHRTGGMLKRRAGGIHVPILEKGLTREELSAVAAVSHAHQG